MQQTPGAAPTNAGRLSGRRVARRTPSASTSTRSRGSGNPNLFNDFFTFDFETVRGIAAAARQSERVPGAGRLHDGPPRRRRNRRAPIVQFSHDVGTAMPMHAAVGVRYEQTDVTSTALVPTPPASAGWRTTSSRWSLRRAGLHDAGRQLRLRPAEPGLRHRPHRQHEAARQLGPDHRPAGLGRHPGRTDPRPARARQRRHRLAGQSRPEAAGVEELSTCRWSGTTAKAATCRSATSTRTSTTTSASRTITRDAVRPASPGSAARTTEAVATTAADRATYLHPQLHLRQPRRPARRDPTGVDVNGNAPAPSSGRPAIRSRPSASPCRPTSAQRHAGRLRVQRAAHVRRQRLRLVGELHDGRFGPEVRQPRRGEQFALEA